VHSPRRPARRPRRGRAWSRRAPASRRSGSSGHGPSAAATPRSGHKSDNQRNSQPLAVGQGGESSEPFIKGATEWIVTWQGRTLAVWSSEHVTTRHAGPPCEHTPSQTTGHQQLPQAPMEVRSEQSPLPPGCTSRDGTQPDQIPEGRRSSIRTVPQWSRVMGREWSDHVRNAVRPDHRKAVGSEQSAPHLA
jgi:hypothetical protein